LYAKVGETYRSGTSFMEILDLATLICQIMAIPLAKILVRVEKIFFRWKKCKKSTSKIKHYTQHACIYST
jgi:hypothetical protein